MLPNIHKILCASDLSDNTGCVMNYAVSMTEQYKAELFVLHVLEPVSSNPYLQLKGFKSDGQLQTLEQVREKKLLQALEGKLKNLCTDMNGLMTSCRIPDDHMFLRKGIPMEEIIKLTRELSIDLVVIGTHGYGLVQEALMGGTARRVVRRSTIPVLVVPNDGG